jgi:hypothetical protein
MKTIIRESRNFALTLTNGQYWLRAKDRDVQPRARHVSQKDAEYLNDPQHFDAAAVVDFGVGVFLRRNAT